MKNNSKIFFLALMVLALAMPTFASDTVSVSADTAPVVLSVDINADALQVYQGDQLLPQTSLLRHFVAAFADSFEFLHALGVTNVPIRVGDERLQLWREVVAGKVIYRIL